MARIDRNSGQAVVDLLTAIRNKRTLREDWLEAGEDSFELLVIKEPIINHSKAAVFGPPNSYETGRRKLIILDEEDFEYFENKYKDKLCEHRDFELEAIKNKYENLIKQ